MAAAQGAAPAVKLTRTQTRAVSQVMNELRHSQPWSFYSTIVLRDFSALATPVLPFWQETRGRSGLAVTNIVQPGQIPEAFKVYGIGLRIAISVYDDPRIFELLANFAALELKIGSDEMIVGPATMFPAGGGVTGMLEACGGQAEPGGGAGGTDWTQTGQSTAEKRAKQKQGPETMEVQAPCPTPLSVLTNGAPLRANVFSLANDPIKVKRGANITTDLHIAQEALDELRKLAPPRAPGATVQLRLEGRRARAAGYGTGG